METTAATALRPFLRTMRCPCRRRSRVPSIRFEVLGLAARLICVSPEFILCLLPELDLAVRSREALPHGLRFEPLFTSDRMLIVPRGRVLAGKKRPTLRDLARHAFVIPPAGSRWRREAGSPWAGDAGGHRRLIRNGRREAVAGGGGEEFDSTRLFSIITTFTET